MNRHLGVLSCIGILLFAGLAYPASYAQSEITLSLDKRLYTVGESVVLVGAVDVPGNIPVIIQVWNPRNEACTFQEVGVNNDGTFTASPILLSGRVCGAPGTYTVKAFYGESEGSITFEVRAQPAAETNGKLQTLLSIVKRAKESVDQKVADLGTKGIQIPDDITQVYDQAVSALGATEAAVDAGDSDSAKQYFKDALKSFKKVFGALTELEQVPAVEAVQAQPKAERQEASAEESARLEQAISRALAFMNKLTKLAASNDLTIPEEDLAAFNSAIDEAREYLDNNDTEAAAQSLARAKQISNDINRSLIQKVKEQKQNRVERFIAQTIERIDEMIEEVKSLGLPQNVIDVLEEAKRRISAAKSIGEVREISEEIQTKHQEISTQKGKNIEKVLQNLQAQLEESRAKADSLGLSLSVYDRVRNMLEDAAKSGSEPAALATLEKASRVIREITDELDVIREMSQTIGLLEDRAGQLRTEHGDDPKKLAALDKASRLLESAGETLVNAMSKKDLKIAYSMIGQAENILERIGGQEGKQGKESRAGDKAEVEEHAKELEQKASRLQKAAEEQENGEALSLIEKARGLIASAASMPEEKYDDAKNLLREAADLLKNAEKLLKEDERTKNKS